MGNLTRIEYPTVGTPARRKVEYVYNSAGELDKVQDTTGTVFDYVARVTYSPLGTPQQLNFANTVQTTLGWDKRGVVTSILDFGRRLW
jgi:hypothetical protein